DVAGGGPLSDGGIVLYGHGGYGVGLFADGQLLHSKVDVDFVASGASLRVTDTNFHHVAVTKSGSTVIFYIDGVAGAPVTYNTVFEFTKNVSIGARLDLSAPSTTTLTSTFAGRIDEVDIWNRALPPAEIRSVYLAGSSGKCGAQTLKFPTPISWWPAEGNANDIIDGNPGTLSATGVTFVGGTVGKAFNFDGTGEVRIYNNVNLNLQTNVTMEAWVFPTVVDG